MVEFMVLSAPRSASTWISNWLTTAKTLCLHDPVLEHAPEAMDAIRCDRTLGVACTALALLPAFVNAHPSRKVIVHRKLEDVNDSLASIGLTPVPLSLWRQALDQIEGLHVGFHDLFDPYTARPIYKFLTGQPFDAARHEQLGTMHVEPHFGKVRIKPERARDFRARLERAFQ